MKKAGLMGIIILLTAIIAFYLLWSKPSNSIQLVKFQGVENAANLSKGYFDWMTSVDSTQKMNAIPAQENDLIYFISGKEDNNDKAFIMRNLHPTNQILHIRFDSLGTYLDDKLVGFSIEKDNHAVDQWLSKSSNVDLKNLQLVGVSDSLTENNFQQLEKIGKANSSLGMIMDTDDPSLARVQEILNPSWLWLTDGKVTSEMFSQWNKTDHLECLVLISAEMREARWDGMKKLKNLYIEDTDSATDAQLGQLPKWLTSLQISNSGIHNLNFLEGHTQLKELSLNFCNELTNISALARLPHLTALSLANCDSLDLEPLLGLKELKWFSPPASITEQQLGSIVHNNPDLETLALVDCSNIKSLDRIKSQHKLAYMALVSTRVVPDSLYRFKELKYLAYRPQDKKDTTHMADLQKQLPNTLVTTAEPFCMGSAWLIVFIGLIILISLIAIRVKSNFSL